VAWLSRGPLALWAADVLALSAAAAVAYVLNRVITFRGDRDARWVSSPGLFAATALIAGVIDVAVLTGGRWLGLTLALAKLAAISGAAAVRWAAYRWILFRWVRRDLAQRVERPPVQAELRLSVIIPAYNEAERIASTVAAVDRELADHLEGGEYEIVVVDDGSTDQTIEIAERARVAMIAAWS
jgi:putative flippase GtrA